MKILIACEFSGIVREAFRLRGHDAWSCDLLPTEIPGQHIQDNVLKHLNDGWDMVIAFPPCTYLTSAGLFHNKKSEERSIKTVEAAQFVKTIMNCAVHKIAIENPSGYLNTHWKKPSQILNPFQFGDEYVKRTCLWLKNIPKLVFYSYNNKFGTNHIVKPKYYYISSGSNYRSGATLDPSKAKRNSSDRSRTFQGIANAMAEQWG